MKNLIIILFVFVLISCDESEYSSYYELNDYTIQGWNTWDNRSILTHVLMPLGYALTVQIHDTLSGDSLVYAFTGNRVPGSEKVRTIAHTSDGRYTECVVEWRDFRLRIQTASEERDNTWLITPDTSLKNPGYLKLNGDVIYDLDGRVTKNSAQLMGELPGMVIQAMSITGRPLVQYLDKPVIYTTNIQASVQSVNALMEARKDHYGRQMAYFGELSETWNAVQNAVNWMVVYDPEKNRAITPVSRPWSYGWGGRKEGGYVMFCWDNFFAAFMHSLMNKKVAFSEAIQLCREVDELGFVPNFASMNGLKSRDRSQPPVGSMMVLEIYKRHPEKWFLKEVFDQLLTWNRWWAENRDQGGYLCWGSNPYEPVLNEKREMVQNEYRAARYESGLDNSPMFDGVPFDTTTHLLQQADVGLMGLYVGDCEALAEIAGIVGRSKEKKELRKRAKQYREKLKTLWDEDFGLFLNKRLDTGELSRRISPTNFYPLIAKAATQEQAERMIDEHFYNPEEFWGEWIMPSIARNDTAYTGRDYWRGSIWAPMNFLVYWGIRNYDLPQARKDLAEKSNALLLKEWIEKGNIRENYDAETGRDPGSRSDHFYHWGGLLGMIPLLEQDRLP